MGKQAVTYKEPEFGWLAQLTLDPRDHHRHLRHARPRRQPPRWGSLMVRYL